MFLRMKNTLDKKFRTACFFHSPVRFHSNLSTFLKTLIGFHKYDINGQLQGFGFKVCQSWVAKNNVRISFNFLKTFYKYDIIQQNHTFLRYSKTHEKHT